jgi:sporulation protein YlmC with PRC-barrel domain
MNPANSLGGIVLAIAVAVLAAHAVSRAQPDPGAAPPALDSGLLASDLLGRTVRSPNGEAVGEIADLVLSPGNTVSSVVVAIGGFLGVGEREVAVPFDKLVVAPDSGAVLVTMSKEQVVAIPEFSSGAARRERSAALPTAPSDAPAAQPNAAARAEANAEAAESFAADDPRVAEGIAENKAAYDKEKKEASPQ